MREICVNFRFRPSCMYTYTYVYTQLLDVGPHTQLEINIRAEKKNLRLVNCQETIVFQLARVAHDNRLLKIVVN